jgi:hypothetical protein
MGAASSSPPASPPTSPPPGGVTWAKLGWRRRRLGVSSPSRGGGTGRGGWWGHDVRRRALWRGCTTAARWLRGLGEPLATAAPSGASAAVGSVGSARSWLREAGFGALGCHPRRRVGPAAVPLLRRTHGRGMGRATRRLAVALSGRGRGPAEPISLLQIWWFLQPWGM